MSTNPSPTQEIFRHISVVFLYNEIFDVPPEVINWRATIN